MKKNSVRVKSISYNALMNGVLSLSSIIFPLITFPYVCRTIGVEVNGQLAFANSIISYFSLFATLGLTTYGIKACAQVRDDRLKLSARVKELLAINIWTTLIAYGVLLSSIVIVPQFRENIILLLIYSLNMIMNVVGLNWFYAAIEQYDYITVRSIIFKMVSLILMFVFVHSPGDSYIYAAISVFANVGGNICNIIYSRKYIDWKTKIGEVRQHIKSTIMFFASALASNIYSNFDTTMLGFINGNYEVGIYAAAVRIKTVLTTLVVSVGNVLLPRMSYYISQNDKDSFTKILKKSYGYLFCASVPVSVYFIVEARASILLLSGAEYLDAVEVMMTLMPILITTCVSNITALQILMPMGQENKYMCAVSVGAVSNVVLNLILMQTYGALGAAIATLVAEIIQLVVQLYFVKEYIKDFFDKEVTAKVVAVTILSTIIILALKKSHLFFLMDLSSDEARAFVELVVSTFIFWGSYLIGLLCFRCSIAYEIWRKISGKLKIKGKVFR